MNAEPPDATGAVLKGTPRIAPRIHAPRIDFTALRRELELPDGFPPEVLHEAEQAALRSPLRAERLPDRTDIPFVTIDPPGSMDLDQAVCILARPAGYRVHYAIADVASLVPAESVLGAETWARGQTIYFPDGRVPLHPEVLSEGAASLLPDQVRAAVLWTIDLDRDGEQTSVNVHRVAVRSRAKLDYATVQRAVDQGTAPEPVALLPEVGKLRLARARRRGAIDLPLPEQEITGHDSGWRLELRAPYPVEAYNAEISLLTGMAAAQIMLDGGIGLLRTLPGPAPEELARVRGSVRALGVDWPDDAEVSEAVGQLDAASPQGAAALDVLAELLRGSGYTAFDGASPKRPEHAGVGAPYAHVTAPLRRLPDRYASAVCLALYHARDVPAHVRDALPRLPEAMAASDRRASGAQRAAIDLVEAVLLADRVGEVFDAAVIERNGGSGATVMLRDPPVRARCDGVSLRPGQRIAVRLLEADPTRRRVRFTSVDV